MTDQQNNHQDIIHRDQVMDYNEVYNQYKKIQETAYKKHNDQYESTRLWLQDLSSQKEYDIYFGNDFRTSFTFAFLSPWQKNILIQCPYWCLDATHKTTNINNCLLYTVVVRHPVTGTGCPVAYCFTTNHAVAPIVELNAIRTVFPEAQVQWCLFHVARAWSSKIREFVKTGSSETNGVLHRAIITALKQMMWERSTLEFIIKLADFLNRFGEHTELIRYLRTFYFANDAFMRWGLLRWVTNVRSSSKLFKFKSIVRFYHRLLHYIREII